MGGPKQPLGVLLLLCLLQLCLAQVSYMIGPASYLDVINRPTDSKRSTSRSSRSSDWTKSYCRVALDGTKECQNRTGIATDSNRDALPTDAQSKADKQTQANPARYQPPMNICLNDWEPMVRCQQGADPSTFSGYQVELFKMLAKEIGWKDEDYYFTCIDYEKLHDDLMSPNGNCSLSATGLEVFPDHLEAGVKFSWPTYKNGLRIMIHANLQHGSTWAFSEVFHWTVWVALGATAVGVGLVIGFIEWATHGNRNIKGWQSWEWYSLAKMVHVMSHVGDPGADASRILMLGYGFLVLVMVSMYTATSASRITAERLVHPVHGKDDLMGRRVLTWDKYVTPLARHHGIKAASVPWEGGADFTSMLKRLKSGDYDALVLDAPVLEYTVGTNPDCDLFTVGEPFETFSQALAFPHDFDDALIFQFSEAIVKLQTYQGALDVLDDVYVKTGGITRCFSGIGGHGKADTIQLRQVSGLWYILLITTGVCFILTAIHNYRNPVAAATLRSISGQIGDLSGRISGNLSGTWGHLSGRFANSAPGALGGQSMTAHKTSDQTIQLGGVQARQPDEGNDMLSLSGATAAANGDWPKLPPTTPRGILRNSGAGGQVLGAANTSQAGAASRSVNVATSRGAHGNPNSGNGAVSRSQAGGLSHGGGGRSVSYGDGLNPDGSVSTVMRSENSKLKIFLGTSEEAYSARFSNSDATDSDEEMP